jgi:hypothetical protein
MLHFFEHGLTQVTSALQQSMNLALVEKNALGSSSAY